MKHNNQLSVNGNINGTIHSKHDTLYTGTWSITLLDLWRLLLFETNWDACTLYNVFLKYTIAVECCF